MSESPSLAQLVFAFGDGKSDGDPGRLDLLGGKGASLAALSRAGFPVPPGFTISPACCAWVHAHQGDWPPGLEEQVRTGIAQLERLTNRRFGSGPRPLFVAVRSGAAVSMPGMMDTILNCGQGADPWSELCQAINAVFASWHSARALAYRRHHDVRGVVGTAATVQAMFPSERSGVLFTANPNDWTAGEMILEASWGLGEAVVSGAVTPDIYILDAATRHVKQVTPGLRPGSEPALTDDQIAAIAALGRRVETHFQSPSDIEWGIADGQIALLQTRPIRGLDLSRDAAAARGEEIARLRQLAGSQPVVWVIHNLAETLPAPTPLTWDLVRWFMSAKGGYGRMYGWLGHRPWQEPSDQAGHSNSFLELIAGRIFVDPRRAAHFHYGKLPFEYDADEIVRDRTSLDRPPTRFNLERADSLFFFRLPGMLFSMWSGARRTRALERISRQRFEQRALPRLTAFLESARAVDLRRIDTRQLLVELDRRREFVLGDFAAESLLPGFFGGLAHERLRQWCDQLLGPEDGEELAGQLTTGLDDDITVRQNIMLFDVAHGRRSLEEFLNEFGHRAANEMELSQPRWSEDPAHVEQMVTRLGNFTNAPSPQDRHAAQVAARRRAEADLPQTLQRCGGASLRERIEHDLRLAQALLPYREIGKFHLMQGYATLRAVLVELGRRWELERDVFFLRDDELPRWEQQRAELETRLASRKLRWRSVRKLPVADIVDSRHLDDFGLPRRLASADHRRLEARPIAAGHSTGTARIVLDPNEVTDLGSDYVLVCPSTDPGWTPLFVAAKGLIVERGGVLSHGAIVARDFGIPAVVCEQATTRIPDSMRVEIDAHHGFVTLLEAK